MIRAQSITPEVIREIVSSTFETIRKKSETNYELILSGAGMEKLKGGHIYYYVNHSSLCPTDGTLNRHISLFRKSKEPELALYDGLFLYASIWEAYHFQHALRKISLALSGGSYPWYVQTSKKVTSNFYKDSIISVIRNNDSSMAELINSLYDSDIRNSIAHSDFCVHDNIRRISFGYQPSLTSDGLFDEKEYDKRHYMEVDDWNRLLDMTCCFYETIYDELRQRRRAFVVGNPGKNISVIPFGLKEQVIIAWQLWDIGNDIVIPHFLISSNELYKTGMKKDPVLDKDWKELLKRAQTFLCQ